MCVMPAGGTPTRGPGVSFENRVVCSVGAWEMEESMRDGREHERWKRAWEMEESMRDGRLTNMSTYSSMGSHVAAAAMKLAWHDDIEWEVASVPGSTEGPAARTRSNLSNLVSSSCLALYAGFLVGSSHSRAHCEGSELGHAAVLLETCSIMIATSGDMGRTCSWSRSTRRWLVTVVLVAFSSSCICQIDETLGVYWEDERGDADGASLSPSTNCNEGIGWEICVCGHDWGCLKESGSCMRVGKMFVKAKSGQIYRHLGFYWAQGHKAFNYSDFTR